MSLVKAGLPFPFNYTDAGAAEDLYIAANIFEIVGTTFTFLAQVPMLHTLFGSYNAEYTFDADKRYLIIKAIYLDSGYTTRDSETSPSTDAIQVVDISAGEAFPQYLIDAIKAVLAATAANVESAIEDADIESEIDDNQVTSEVTIDPEIGC